MQMGTEYIKEELEKSIQFLSKINHTTNVYVAAFDRFANILIDFPCSEEEKALIGQLISDEARDELLNRVILSKLEDQIVEDGATSDSKVAVSAIKMNGKCEVVWFFVAQMEDSKNPVLSRTTTLPCFLETIDIVRQVTEEKLQIQMSIDKQNEENKKSRSHVDEITASLHRIEALTEIVNYLDSDKSIEYIMQDFLRITGEYLQVSRANIFKTADADYEHMDVVASWHAKGLTSFYEKTLHQKRLSFLKGNKPVIVSYDSPFLTQFLDENPDMNVSAYISMPVMIGDKTNFYVAFCEINKLRTWQLEEIQFLSDAVRVLQNIIEKRIQKNSLASSYASLEEILENVGCAIIVNNPANNDILFRNGIMKNTFPKNSMEPEFWAILQDYSEEKSEIEYYDRNRLSWYEIHHNNITWVDGSPAALYSIFDVTDKKNYQRKIEQQAYTDFLTGLFNRMCCERDLAKIVDEAKKYDETGALLYLDLDDFKHINDGLGHQYGDVLLKSISNSMRRIEGIENTCYRMGGDEFVIIIPPQSYLKFEHIVDDIKTVFAKPWFLKDADYYCTMSMGIVTFPDEGENVADLIKKADIAMYEAKKTGKNRVARYNRDHSSLSNKRLDMEKNMRDATANGYEEFEIYYQPIIDIQKKGTPCTGAEALIRWNSTELGFISPGDFIPLAEYLGLINPIGNHVLREACKTCHYWNENGHPEYKVNVNLSVVQLLQNNIVETVEDTIKETQINPRNLTLEVTESLAINDMERMKEIMSQIRRLGVRIALDDFGTGYSSLNHIREIPLDVIKVDQSFVRDLVDDDYSKSFIKMVAELAGAIGVSICVEGIEKREQYKVLEGMKVRLVQGFFFDRPMPRDQFEAKYLK